MKHRNNFYTNTVATFKGCNPPNREPDYISGYSEYWYTEKGVYRRSNHWSMIISPREINGDHNNTYCVSTCYGRLYIGKRDPFLQYDGNIIECQNVASCWWRLRTVQKLPRARVCGFCKWADFKDRSEVYYKTRKKNNKKIIASRGEE